MCAERGLGLPQAVFHSIEVTLPQSKPRRLKKKVEPLKETATSDEEASTGAHEPPETSEADDVAEEEAEEEEAIDNAAEKVAAKKRRVLLQHMRRPVLCLA